MFDTMKLGTKIAAGYAGVLIVSSLVTAFTLLQVSTQTAAANELAGETAPQVQLANELERLAAATMKDMKTYELTMNAEFLARGLANLEKLDAALVQAQEHVKKHPNLTSFAASADKVAVLLRDFRALVDRTKLNTTEVLAGRAALNAAAKKFVDASDAFERLRPESLELHQVAVAATEARLEAWKAQALDDPKALDAALASLVVTNKELGTLAATVKDEGLVHLIDSMRGAAADYEAQVKLVQAGMVEDAQLGQQRVALGDQVVASSKAVAVTGIADTMKGSTGVADALAGVRVVVALGLVLALVLGISMAFVVTRAITKPVNRIIAGLTGAGEQVASASSQVSSSSQQLANGASQQASNLEEVSSSLEEVTSMTRQNADNARKANVSAKEAADAANQGASSMARMNDAMQKIRSSATETAKIVKTIDEIAFQTNLLALNAAVEAARAGEAGKGFAVVAEEVRNLAQRSAEAAKTTASLIEEAQRNAESGAAISDEVSGILKEIVTGAGKVTSLVADVATASEQQTSGVTQINTAVSQMDRITQSNAGNAEESASASEELSAQAVELNEMVEQLGQLVNGVGSVAAAQSSRRPAAKRAAAHRAIAPAASAVKPQRPHAAPPPARRTPPPSQGAGFEPLPSAVVDPRELIPLDDSELKSF
ncbi:MAG: methyl-accepting chemotaxis protein [Archangium sp.]|nr:methyl-accepting chemotaxis protein [Archangium sp.]